MKPMPFASSIRRNALLLVAVPLCSTLVSCSEELQNETPKTAVVSGRVVEGGRPIQGGWIEFIPTDGTIGRLKSSPIAKDGSFRVEGVGVGTNAVGLVDIPSTLQGGRRGFDTLGTPIRRQIGSAKNSALTIDLIEEAAALSALRGSAR